MSLSLLCDVQVPCSDGIRLEGMSLSKLKSSPQFSFQLYNFIFGLHLLFHTPCTQLWFAAVLPCMDDTNGLKLEVNTPKATRNPHISLF